MKIFIAGGGEKPSKELFNYYNSISDYSIALDSGLDVFLDYGIKPDYLMGDFDSTKKTEEDIKQFNFIKYPIEKDYTDGEIGIEKAIELAATEIYLLAMTGGRLDHLMGNIGLVKKALDNGIKAFIIDDKNILTMVNSSVEIEKRDKKYISFYAYGGEVLNLSLKGSKYELSNYNLKPFEGICNSNEFKEEKINVTFEKGTLIIIYSQD